jgi:hypothetical protein
MYKFPLNNFLPQNTSNIIYIHEVILSGVRVCDLIAMMVQAWTDTLDIYSIRIGINYGFVAQYCIALRSLVIEKIETENVTLCQME